VFALERVVCYRTLVHFYRELRIPP